MKEATPLKWPQGWPRTLPEKQESNSQWKKPRSFYVAQLEAELKRIHATISILTLNTVGDRDPGVSVWFSRPKKEDFSWRETLRIFSGYPTTDEVDEAYRKMVAVYHPDRGGDINIFHKITDARAKAKEWVNHQEGNTFDYAIGADKFKEARLNIAALANSIRHIRGLERCGTSAIMEKTFEGFAQLAEKAESHVPASA
jgi:hypothetical protein